ncbi:MAG: hypothetical protein IPM06_07475 [Rhizobiales bacterium]|nr:hypothetical protein [Hyphomicrobiales bacterium]
MKRAPRSRQRHDLYAKYHDYDSEISDLLGECGVNCFFLIAECLTMPMHWRVGREDIYRGNSVAPPAP